MTRIEADEYLKIKGFQIIRKKGVIYAAVINDSGHPKEFKIEVLIDSTIFDDGDLDNYMREIDLSITRLEDLKNQIVYQRDHININIEISNCLNNICEWDVYKDLIKERKSKSKVIELEYIENYIQEIDYSINHLKTNLKNVKYESLKQIESLIKSDLDEIDKNLEKKIPKKIVIKNKKYKVELLNDKKKLRRGNTVKNESISDHGRIGGILKLGNQNNDYYLISNWHNLMGYNGEIGNNINRDQEPPFAELFWARHDSEYDIAIAKIKNFNQVHIDSNECNSGSIENKPIEAEIGMPVSICYNKISNRSTNIRSTNAYVKLDTGKLYKNQILTEESISSKGHSGSLLISGNKVVGLVFAGDQRYFTIANPLYELFNNIIDFTIINNEYIDDFESFQFEKFITNN